MKKLFFLVLFLYGFQAIAQQRFGSLQEVFAYADVHAAAIKNAGLQQKISHSQARAAKEALLPTVNGSAGYTDNITLQPTLVPANLFDPTAPAGTYNEFTFGRKYLYTTGLQANWNLLDFEKWFAVKTAAAQEAVSKASVTTIRYNSFNELAQTYYAILLTEKYIAISAENLMVADSIFKTSSEKYGKGIITQENLNRANIQHIQAKNSLDNLQYSVKELYYKLQQQLNIIGPIVLTDSINIQDPPFKETAINAPHPEVQLQEAQATMAEARLKQVKSLYYPSLNLLYQYNYTWAGDSFLNFGNTNQLPQQLFAVKLSVPIFNGLATREKVLQTNLTLEQQQTLLESKKIQAAKEDETLLLQYQQSVQELQKQGEILYLQQQNDVFTANRYNSGIISLDERLDKFADLLAVQNQYMQALSNYYISYYKIYIRQTITTQP
ncbi:TolC family protein [Flavobacterium sp. RHBU_3]|uniref:TolC family protein n=1 Tax=Flavobacterium sp. RHBU_3 TaxID=3391184 RepID=UPI0039855518